MVSKIWGLEQIRTNLRWIKRTKKLYRDAHQIRIQRSNSRGSMSTWIHDNWKNILAWGDLRIYELLAVAWRQYFEWKLTCFMRARALPRESPRVNISRSELSPGASIQLPDWWWQSRGNCFYKVFHCNVKWMLYAPWKNSVLVALFSSGPSETDNLQHVVFTSQPVAFSFG